MENNKKPENYLAYLALLSLSFYFNTTFLLSAGQSFRFYMDQNKTNMLLLFFFISLYFNGIMNTLLYTFLYNMSSVMENYNLIHSFVSEFLNNFFQSFYTFLDSKINLEARKQKLMKIINFIKNSKIMSNFSSWLVKINEFLSKLLEFLSTEFSFGKIFPKNSEETANNQLKDFENFTKAFFDPNADIMKYLIEPKNMQENNMPIVDEKVLNEMLDKAVKEISTNPNWNMK